MLALLKEIKNALYSRAPSAFIEVDVLHETLDLQVAECWSALAEKDIAFETLHEAKKHTPITIGVEANETALRKLKKQYKAAAGGLLEIRHFVPSDKVNVIWRALVAKLPRDSPLFVLRSVSASTAGDDAAAPAVEQSNLLIDTPATTIAPRPAQGASAPPLAAVGAATAPPPATTIASAPPSITSGTSTPSQ
jgi:hypothetical protein